MRLKDLMDKERAVITIRFDESVKVALDRLIENKISAMPVLDEDRRVMGMISERDILRELYNDPLNIGSKHVGDAMTKEILIGLADDDLDYIMNIMSRNSIRHMPIMAGNNLIGIISIRDVVKGLMHKVAAENRYLKDYIEGKYEGYL